MISSDDIRLSDIDRVARALCRDSAQANEATRMNDKGKRRYETVDAYVDDHWRHWLRPATTAVVALTEAAEPRKTLGDAVRAARGGDASTPQQGFA